jgi:hypothetical protein
MWLEPLIFISGGLRAENIPETHASQIFNSDDSFSGL